MERAYLYDENFLAATKVKINEVKDYGNVGDEAMSGLWQLNMLGERLSYLIALPPIILGSVVHSGKRLFTDNARTHNCEASRVSAY